MQLFSNCVLRNTGVPWMLVGASSMRRSVMVGCYQEGHCWVLLIPSILICTVTLLGSICTFLNVLLADNEGQQAKYR